MSDPTSPAVISRNEGTSDGSGGGASGSGGSAQSIDSTVAAPGDGNSLLQATGPNQTVVGSSAGPETLIGGFSGDTLEGSSGDDTFDYNVGSGAETIVAATDDNGNHNNTLQFGAGITPTSLTASVTDSGELMLNTGGRNDNVTLDAIQDPYTFSIDHFVFSDGISLSLTQLLSQIQPSFGSGYIPSDGINFTYAFNISGGPLYYLEVFNPSDQTLSNETLERSGIVDLQSYEYNSGAGTTTVLDTQLSPDDVVLSASNTLRDSQGRIVNESTLNADGTIDNINYTYNSDGTSSSKDVHANASHQVLATTVTDYDSQDRVTSSDVTNADGSTVDATHAYNADGSYERTVVTSPAGGGAPTTLTYNYDVNGNLITEYQATEPNQTVTGPSSGPDTLIGGYSGDVLVGGSGDDTFDYDVGSGAETIVAATDANGNHDNTLQFGAGITPTSLTASITDGGELMLNTGNPNDNVTLGSILDPYKFSIDLFVFSNGTSVSLTQLLSRIQPSFGSGVFSSDGSSFFYDFNIGPLYYIRVANSSGQPLGSVTLEDNGIVDVKSYKYNSDGGTTFIEKQLSPDDLLLSYSSTTRDSQGRITNESTLNADGSGDNSSYMYNSDGTSSSRDVQTNASGQVLATTVTDYDSQDRVTSSDVTNADGSTVDATYAYNADGSYEETVVTSPAGGGAPTTLTYNYDANGNLITVYQATGPGQTITGPSSGPDTLIGGYSGDVLVGGSGDDTFDYNAGSGAETIVATTDANGNHNNTLQFGAGITPSSLTASITDDGELMLNTGNPNDTVTLGVLLDPYEFSIDHFAFSNGSSLSLAQLLSQVQPSFGSGVLSSDNNTIFPAGSSFFYDFNIGPLYYIRLSNSSGQLIDSETVEDNGIVDLQRYEYNSDGSTTFLEAQISPDDLPMSSSSTVRDSQGQIIDEDNTSYTYNSDGTISSKDVQTNASGQVLATTLTDYDSQYRVTSSDVTNADGSTVDATYAYNADGSYEETVVTSPAGGGAPTTLTYNYDANGNLITLYQATGPDQTITGPSSGPDTLVGGYSGDVLVGTSGSDTFDYNAGSGAETLSKTASVSSTSDNVIQFGSGITVASIALSANSDGALVLTLGSNGDSVTIDGFNPVDPIGSSPIQQFEFSDGTSLTLAQLLMQVEGPEVGSSISNADGSTTSYDFAPGNNPVYSAQINNAAGQITQSFLVGSDGSTQGDSYTYNSDGSSVQTEVDTSADGETTTTVLNYDSGGNLTAKEITYPGGATELDTVDAQGRPMAVDITSTDGTTNDSTYSYNADGSHVQTQVYTPAGGEATTTVWNYDSSGNLTSREFTYPDGNTEIDTYDAQGRTVTADSTGADGTTNDSTYSYNADGSYVQRQVYTPPGGQATTTVWNYDSSGNLTTTETTYPGGNTELDTYNAQGQKVAVDSTGADGTTNDSTYTFNADGSYVQTQVYTPPGGQATSTVWNYDSSGNLTTKKITYPEGNTEVDTYNAQGQQVAVDSTGTDGTTEDSTYSYNADGSSVQTEVYTPAGGQATTTVWSYDASGTLTTKDVTNPDGSTVDTTYSYNADGSSVRTEVDTPADGGAATTIVGNYDASGNVTGQDTTYPGGSKEADTFDAQGRELVVDITRTDGSTQDSTYSYNADGSAERTEVDTPAGGAAATTTIWNYDSSHNVTSADITYPDGSTEVDTFDAQGREAAVDITSTDGSTQNYTNSYNADGSSVQTEVDTPAGGAATTVVRNYDSSGNLVSDNSYAPTSDGSYTDSWDNGDGSKGGYWWNASTVGYQATWYDASEGVQSTDVYQYSSGGSPGSSGASFVETYSDSAGDQGTRRYDASTGITSVSWYSAATGAITGTVTDSGFIGLQNEGELTNTQNDPSFFNPTTSPAFQNLLAGHAG